MDAPTTDAVPAGALRKGDRVILHGHPVTATRKPAILTGAARLGKARVYVEYDDGTRDQVELPVNRPLVRVAA